MIVDDEQEGFRAGRGRIYQIFTLKQIGEEQERRNAVYVGFKDLENA